MFDSLLPTDGTTEVASLADMIHRGCSPEPFSEYVEGCAELSDSDKVIQHLTMLLSQVLGYKYTGTMEISNFEGVACMDCCEDNANVWTVDDLNVNDY